MTQKVKSVKPKAIKPKAAAKPKGSAKPKKVVINQPATPLYRVMQRELSAKIRAAKNPLERNQLRREYAASIKQARIQSVRNAYPQQQAA